MRDKKEGYEHPEAVCPSDKLSFDVCLHCELRQRLVRCCRNYRFSTTTSEPHLHYTVKWKHKKRTRNWTGQKRKLWPILRHCCSICLGLKYENSYTIRGLEAEVSKRRLLNNEAGMLTRSTMMFILKVSHLGTFYLDP
jgi:hypothetical protein